MFVPDFLRPKNTPVTYDYNPEQIRTMQEEAVGPLADSEVQKTLDDSDIPEQEEAETEPAELPTTFFKHMQGTSTDFFDCNGADLVWSNYAQVEGLPFFSPCVAESIRQGFLFTPKDISTIT